MALASKPEKERKVSACLDFAGQLLRRLDAANIGATVLSELKHHIENHTPVPHASKVIEFDKIGTELWNTTVRLRERTPQILDTFPHLESQLRVFSYFLLEAAQQAYVKHGSQKSHQNAVRIVKTAFKAARVCINANDLHSCTKLFEKVSNYVENRHNPPIDVKQSKDVSEAEDMFKELTADYYLLRATLSWKQEKPDNASWWLNKVILQPDRIDMLHLAEKKADLGYEIGKAALVNKHYDHAVKWLELSSSVFDDIDSEMLSPECCDLRLAIMLNLSRAYIGVGDVVSLERATNVIVLLDQENGFKTEIFLLRLDIIFAQRPFQADEFQGVLIKIIRVSIISEGTSKTVIHQIQKLNAFDPEKGAATNQNTSVSTPGPYSQLACQALDLLLSRLLETSPVVQLWLERAVVTRIWISSLTLQIYEHPQKLRALLDEIYGVAGNPLGLEATHASQSLIWKAVTALQAAKNESAAAEWCNLACHELFSNAGDLNKAKLGRKMMMNALARGDAIGAREAYYKMPENGKTSAMSKYLMYKIALQDGDTGLASECLEGILKASSGADKFLYACALEAQQTGSRKQAIETLNKILEYYERHSPSEIQLPALLRCIAVSILTEIKNGNMPLNTALPELCKIFEGAMRHANTLLEGDQGNSNSESYLAELRWFACHSYNTALKHCSEMHPELLLRFTMIGVSLISLLRKECANDEGLLNRLLLCRFLASSTLIVMARSEENVEASLQNYLDARRQIEAFDSLYKEVVTSESIKSEIKSDLAAKEFEMIKFDLEALMRLDHWNDLDRVLTMCLDQRHTERLNTAADLIIHIHSHVVRAELDTRYQSKIPNVMEKIINISWRNNKDITRLARWIRCLFQMTMNFDPALSLRCIDQARAIADKAQLGQIPDPYPRDELEWLVTSSFNHAVDLHCAAPDDIENGGQIWAEKALNLAMAAGDGSGLHGVLQGKWAKLRGFGRDG